MGKEPVPSRRHEYEEEIIELDECCPSNIVKEKYPEVAKFNLQRIPSVYWLCYKGKVLYIGQTTDILQRVFSHRSYWTRDFDEIFYLPIEDEKERTRLEHQLIAEFNPPLNR